MSERRAVGWHGSSYGVAHPHRGSATRSHAVHDPKGFVALRTPPLSMHQSDRGADAGCLTRRRLLRQDKPWRLVVWHTGWQNHTWEEVGGTHGVAFKGRQQPEHAGGSVNHFVIILMELLHGCTVGHHFTEDLPGDGARGPSVVQVVVPFESFHGLLGVLHLRSDLIWVLPGGEWVCQWAFLGDLLHHLYHSSELLAFVVFCGHVGSEDEGGGHGLQEALVADEAGAWKVVRGLSVLAPWHCCILLVALHPPHVVCEEEVAEIHHPVYPRLQRSNVPLVLRLLVLRLEIFMVEEALEGGLQKVQKLAGLDVYHHSPGDWVGLVHQDGDLYTVPLRAE
eukprot:CAMPEP_0117692056 /NCGR_PEP_ID=MMETSP0804-20121206/26098_1 /TAXON_ID=1074897 /ORGANISM="Tetraselmis astigmatica, Strain CCMP880" /LENGTH=336 /DNA_ID=CAMNT_0005505427 /DNA_START=246 /DNA_END=1256 /DNA_ORIENTATION=-